MNKQERRLMEKVLRDNLKSYQSFRDAFQWDESPQARREEFLRQKRVLWIADALVECGFISCDLWDEIYEQADALELKKATNE